MVQYSFKTTSQIPVSSVVLSLCLLNHERYIIHDLMPYMCKRKENRMDTNSYNNRINVLVLKLLYHISLGYYKNNKPHKG